MFFFIESRQSSTDAEYTADEWILSTTMPSVPIEHLAEWEKRALSGKLIAFEMVIIVDRCESSLPSMVHRGGLTDALSTSARRGSASPARHSGVGQGACFLLRRTSECLLTSVVYLPQMNSHMATLVSHTRDFFAPFRQIALSQLGISTSLRPTKPVVIYLDRNRNVRTDQPSPSLAFPQLISACFSSEKQSASDGRVTQGSHKDFADHRGTSRGPPERPAQHEKGGGRPLDGERDGPLLPLPSSLSTSSMLMS